VSKIILHGLFVLNYFTWTFCNEFFFLIKKG